MNHTAAVELLAATLAPWVGPATPQELAELLDVDAVIGEAFRTDPDHGLWLAVDTATLRQIAMGHILTGTPAATDLPCPPWCELPAGHPLSDWDRGLFREHLRRFGDKGPQCVELVTTEYAATPAGPIVYGDPGHHLILPELDPSATLTAAEARALAANLAEAAEVLDQCRDTSGHAET